MCELGESDYTQMCEPGDKSLPSRGVRRGVLVSGAALGAAIFGAFLLLALPSASTPFVSLGARPPVAHTGQWCAGEGAAGYSKSTLKTIVDRTVAGLLPSPAWLDAGKSKFEASDVIRVGNCFYVVCDSSWSILRIDESLPLLSAQNTLITPAEEPPKGEDSGFEALLLDKASGSFFAIREAIELPEEGQGLALSREGQGLVLSRKKASCFHAIILQLDIQEDSYRVREACRSEFEFEGESKGFEGAVSIRGKDGVMYILGLCEGNWCSEGSRGKEAGNGRVVVMARADGEGGEEKCVWKTVRVLHLPKDVDFIDYSAMTLQHSTKQVAISSQVGSQLWVGELTGAADGEFDPTTAQFQGGRIYDFPRGGGDCEAQYCNIEGVHWLEGSKGSSASATPRMLVAVSDKMKSGGRQAFTCQEKDQSVHLFTLP